MRLLFVFTTAVTLFFAVNSFAKEAAGSLKGLAAKEMYMALYKVADQKGSQVKSESTGAGGWGVSSASLACRYTLPRELDGQKNITAAQIDPKYFLCEPVEAAKPPKAAKAKASSPAGGQ